jgi:hypothetical protein
MEQEAYGCYYSIHAFEYKLRGKHFILETDHRNLLWMEKSVVPKVMRWVLYMRSFSFQVRHVAGKLNRVADHLSRYFLYSLHESLSLTFPDFSFSSLAIDSMFLHALSLPHLSRSPTIECESSEGSVSSSQSPSRDPNRFQSIEDILSQVHSSRKGHWGVRTTMKILDNQYPGHKIPVEVVHDYIAQCPTCQKNRSDMVDSIKPIIRHLKPEYQRKTVGVDTLTITPPDIYGNQYLIVFVVLYSKLSWGYPTSNKLAETLAGAICIFFSLYGMFDCIISDPGSDLTSDVISQVN